MSCVRLVGYSGPVALDAVAAALVFEGRELGAGAMHGLAALVALVLTCRGLRAGAAGSGAAAHAGAASEGATGAGAASADTTANGRATGEVAGAALAAAVLVLVLPMVGAALLAFVAWPSWSRRPEPAAAGVIEVALPDGSGEVDDAPLARSLAVRPIRELLRDARSPDERVRAVMALRHMEARRAVPLLRMAFSHENEDVRLLAFGILEQREKGLRSSIERSERRLGGSVAAAPEAPRAAALSRRWHQRLARDHWELVYGGFVSGDLEPVVLGKARDHALAALAERADAKMSLLLARIYLRRRQPEAAQHYLEQALRAGLSAASAAPLLAEAAFQRRRFGDIPRILRGVRRAALRRAELDPIAAYWTSEA